MSYVPPSKKNESNNRDTSSSFVSSNSNKPEIDLEQEYFPTLGGTECKQTDVENDISISFACSLTTEIPKEKVIKEIEDGWLCIRNNGSEPEFLYGEMMTETFKEKYKVIDEIKRYKMDTAIYRTLKNYERYKVEDENKYGQPTIQSWEVDAYIEEMEMNTKFQRLEEEFMLDNYDSSDDDYTTN